jgi:branched-chain amino acid transport system ATP-binding protein
MTLELDSVVTGYGRAPVLHQISLRVGDDETLAILGPNGAGKTSLLKAIVGVLPLHEGQLSLDGRSLTRLRTPARAALGIAWVPEGRRLFASLTVGENLHVAARGVDGSVAEQRIEDVFSLFPAVRALMNRPAWALSGGQQQMVAIGRALMARPRILLLDEPSLGLAPIVVNTLIEALRALGERGQSMILVEQNVVAGLRIADRALVLSRGRVIHEGSPSELLDDERVRKSYLSEAG